METLINEQGLVGDNKLLFIDRLALIHTVLMRKARKHLEAEKDQSGGEKREDEIVIKGSENG